jgi:hypothetical protein
VCEYNASYLAFPKLSLNVCSSYTFVRMTMFSLCTNVDCALFSSWRLPHHIFINYSNYLYFSKKRHLWMNMLMRSCYILLRLPFFHLVSSDIKTILHEACQHAEASSHSYQQTKKHSICNLSRLGVEFSYYWQWE